MHPVSTATRPVGLFIAESGIDVEEQMIGLMTGEHLQDPYASMNPNKLLPMLEDGDFRLTESSAILKYPAGMTGSPAYPKEFQQRAKVNEMMDWFDTNFYRDFGYGMVYPQLFPHHRRPSDEHQSGTIDWAKGLSQNWFKVLDSHWLGPDKPYLCGNEITIADYFGAGLLTIGELIRCDFSPYPNIQRWLGNMKQLKSWESVNEVMYGFADSVKDQQFIAI